MAAVRDKIQRLSFLEKEFARLRLEILKRDTLALLDNAETVNGTKMFCNRYQDVKIDLLRQIADLVKSKLTSYALCLASSEGSKAWLLIVLSDDLVRKGLDAVKIIKDIAVAISGDGGGRPSMAQAGGDNNQGIFNALDKFKATIISRLKQAAE